MTFLSCTNLALNHLSAWAGFYQSNLGAFDCPALSIPSDGIAMLDRNKGVVCAARDGWRIFSDLPHLRSQPLLTFVLFVRVCVCACLRVGAVPYSNSSFIHASLFPIYNR